MVTSRVPPTWVDRLGGVASAACAVHCLALSAVPALIPMLGLGVLSHEAFEWAFSSVALGLALVAAVLGYRVHRTPWVLAGFGVGMLVLLMGRVGEALELYGGGGLLAVFGGALLVVSHVASARRTVACSGACST